MKSVLNATIFLIHLVTSISMSLLAFWVLILTFMVLKGPSRIFYPAPPSKFTQGGWILIAAFLISWVILSGVLTVKSFKMASKGVNILKELYSFKKFLYLVFFGLSVFFSCLSITFIVGLFVGNA